MLIHGNFRNKNYPEHEFYFIMEAHLENWHFMEFDNKNLPEELNNTIGGRYNLLILDRNDNTVYNTSNGKLETVEILNLISSNKNWELNLNGMNVFIDDMEKLIIQLKQLLPIECSNFREIEISNFYDYIERTYNDYLMKEIFSNSFIETWNKLTSEFLPITFDSEAKIKMIKTILKTMNKTSKYQLSN